MTAGRKHIMLGTAGHVDHGKTALVKLLTGCDTDRLAAEKQRGLTIELGFAPCSMRDGRIVGIVDVPGHADFIRNMVAGAQGIDVVIFVVAADDGVMPQTREHLDILTLMGVAAGVVAVTKRDLVDAETLELVCDEVRQFTAGTFLAGAAVCPVSGTTGEGFNEFLEALDAAASACRDRPADGLFRVWIERSFTVHGFGSVASGIAAAGQVRVGDRLTLLPGGLQGRVRRLEVYGQEDSLAQAGECVAMNLADLPADELLRGRVLCEAPTEPVTMLEADLQLVASVAEPLADYAHVHLHVGTAEAMAHVAVLDDSAVQPGRRHLVQMRLDEPLAVVPGERFVIRGPLAGVAGGRVTTLGGGRVLGVSNKRLRRNRPWTLEALSRRAEAVDSPAAWCLLMLAEAGAPVSAGALAAATMQRADSVAESLAASDVAIALPGGLWIHAEVLDLLAERIVAALAEFHAADATRLGMAAEKLQTATDAHPAALALAVERLTSAGAVVKTGQVIALAGRGGQLSAEDDELCRQVAAALQAAGLAPPSPAELAETLGVPAARLQAAIRTLADRGDAVQLDEKVVMHRDAINSAKKVALELFARSRRFTTMQFRDALGVSRRYAVPLLDHFDKVHLTVRSGSSRTPGAAARQ